MKLLMVVMLMAMPLATVAADEPLDSPSSMLGQLYLRYDVDMYRGVMNFERQLEDGQERIRAEFYLNLQFEVTHFEVNGDILHDDSDNPLPGLPENAEGEVKNLSLHLWALSGGQGVLYGNTWLEILRPGDGINVTLYPNRERQFLPYDAPGGIDPTDLDLVIGDLGGGSRYHPDVGGFYYWPDPLAGEVAYRIINRSTGEVLSSGQLSPVDRAEERPDHPVSVQLAGGVLSVNLTDQYEVRYRGVNLDGWEWVGDELWPAKVFIITRNGNEDTWFHLQDFDGIFEVLEWRSWGEMPQVPVAISEIPGGAISIPRGPEKLVMVFFNDNDHQFSVRFSRHGGLG